MLGSDNEEIHSNEISERHSAEIEFLTQLTSPFTEWLNDIVKSANETIENRDDGDRDNVMYKPIFANDFVRLCKILPLCCDLFELEEVTFSSGNAELDMKNVKQFLEDIIPCSADVFVEEHIGMLKGGAIEASQHSNYVEFIGGNTQKPHESEDAANQSENLNDSEVERNDENECDSQSSNIAPNASCQNGGRPRGTHRCRKCKKAVHILPCCSISIADDEACGVERLCNACARPDPATSSQISSASQSISEMEYNEPWNKSKHSTRTRSKFLQKAPNWNLNTNIEKKQKLGILVDGNKSNITYKVNKGKTVTMTNTCAIDSPLQVNDS